MRRSSKGYYRGRGKARSAERGYARGNRSRGYSGSNNQNAAPKDVKGRGPRRYQPSMKDKSEVLPPQNKQLGILVSFSSIIICISSPSFKVTMYRFGLYSPQVSKVA